MSKKPLSEKQHQLLLETMVDALVECFCGISDDIWFAKVELPDAWGNISCILDWAGLSINHCPLGWYVGDLRKPSNQISMLVKDHQGAMLIALGWIKECVAETGDIDVTQWSGLDVH
jgi:hypothetical protein